MMPLLYWNLKATCPEVVPKAALAQLQSAFVRNSAHNLFLCEKLLTVLRGFEQENIPALPYKGLVLAASVYGKLFLRQCADLDILVPKQDFSRAKALLVAHSYRPRRQWGWESSFVDVNDGVCVDLHQNIVPQYIPLPLDFVRVWEHRESACIASATVPTLSAEETLIFLCVQAAKDEWDSCTKLAKIVDIAELLHVSQKMDWERVMHETRRLRCRRMLFFGLRLASVLLDAELPQEVLREMSVHPSVNSLVVEAVRRFFYGTDNGYPILRTADRLVYRFRFHFEVRERLGDKWSPFLYYPLSIPQLCGFSEIRLGKSTDSR
jgi:hypothetical protein